MSDAAQPVWASGVCEGLHAAGVRHVVYVPDNPTSHVLRVLGERFASIRTTTATREEEAFGIAAGLYLGGVRPAVMLQSSGLGNSFNALTSLLIPYRIPAVMLISLRGEAGEWNPAQMPMGQALRPILAALRIPHQAVDDPASAERVTASVARAAFETKMPGACLLARRVTVPAA